MKENQLELADIKLAEVAGWEAFKGISTSTTGTGDRIFIQGGLCFFVERKKPGKKLKANQEAFKRRMDKAGTPCYKTDDTTQNQMLSILVKEGQRLEDYENGTQERK